jgi:hypothetical protein
MKLRAVKLVLATSERMIRRMVDAGVLNPERRSTRCHEYDASEVESAARLLPGFRRTIRK